jgi:carbon storage regulator CsrA
MLVVARRLGENLLIGNNIELTVKEINSCHIKLCINNSENITVDK